MTLPRGGDPGGVVLALDPGTVRVGIAASDATRTIATPVASVARERELWQRLRREVAEREVGVVIVGLPRRLDGGEGAAAAQARALAADVHARTGLAVLLWDERFTSVQAERALIAAGVRRRKRRGTVDATAATLLLQSWLDAPAARRDADPVR